VPLKGGFGIWLRNERESRGMTMAALAHKVGITYTHISKIEAGRAQPSREMVRQLIKAMDADMRTGLMVARFLPSEFQGLTDKRLQEIVLNFSKISPETQEQILKLVQSSPHAIEHYDEPPTYDTFPLSCPDKAEYASSILGELPSELLDLSIQIAETMLQLSKQQRSPS